jgi:hypothetical protein
LKKYVRSGISPFTIREVPRVREDEVIIAVLSTAESLPASLSIDGLVGGGLLADSLALECRAGALAQVAE